MLCFAIINLWKFFIFFQWQIYTCSFSARVCRIDLYEVWYIWFILFSGSFETFCKFEKSTKNMKSRTGPLYYFRKSGAIPPRLSRGFSSGLGRSYSWSKISSKIMISHARRVMAWSEHWVIRKLWNARRQLWFMLYVYNNYIFWRYFTWG